MLGTGTVVGGHYKIVRHLGGGGFGQTYLAEDTHKFGAECVVKQLQPKSSRNLPQARKLFEREGKTLERLGGHDQIPQLLAYFEENEQFYLVQEYIEGHDLSREINPGKVLAESYVVKLLGDVLPILEYVHGEQVIHRDIKPPNIIRSNQGGKLVLIDFGAVKEKVVERPDSSIVIGTEGYVPIEQILKTPNYSSDIHALGMMSIQALTGRSPRDIPRDETKEEVHWRSLAGQVSEELAAILCKMVRYDCRERYQSAREVLNALGELPGGQTISHSTSTVTIPQNSQRTGTQGTSTVTIHQNSQKTGAQGATTQGQARTEVGKTELEEPKKRKVKLWQVVAGVAGVGVLLGLVEIIYPIGRPAYYLWEGNQRLQEYKPEEALEAFEKITSDLHENHRAAWKGQGDALFTLRKHRRALKAYEKVLQLYQNDPKNLNNKGKVLYQLGRYEEALAAHEEAIALEGENARAWNGKGIALIGMKKYSEAIEAFNEAQKLAPNQPQVWQSKGIALDYLGEETREVYQAALDIYDRTLKTDPSNRAAWVDRGGVLMKMQDFDEALASYEKVLSMSPRYYPALVAKGNVLGIMGKAAEAVEVYDEALKIWEKDYQVWYNKGALLVRAPNRKQEAVESLEKSLQYKRDFYPALLNLGVVLSELGEYERAMEVLEKAKNIKEKDPYVWANIGNVLEKMGRKGEAINAYEKALSLEPNFSAVRKALEELQ